MNSVLFLHVHHVQNTHLARGAGSNPLHMGSAQYLRPHVPARSTVIYTYTYTYTVASCRNTEYGLTWQSQIHVDHFTGVAVFSGVMLD